MTVSVTGATGFIGRRLVQRLRAGILLLCLYIDMLIIVNSDDVSTYIGFDANESCTVISSLLNSSFFNGFSSLSILQRITLSGS